MPTKQKSRQKTKAYNLSLDSQAVEEARQILQGDSFSSYLSDLIKQDLFKKRQAKTMAEIFGKNFKPIPFKNKNEEKQYYELIGLKDYALQTKD